MRYHIVTNEVVSYYTEIEAEDEEQARETALKKVVFGCVYRTQ